LINRKRAFAGIQHIQWRVEDLVKEDKQAGKKRSFQSKNANGDFFKTMTIKLEAP